MYWPADSLLDYGGANNNESPPPTRPSPNDLIEKEGHHSDRSFPQNGQPEHVAREQNVDGEDDEDEDGDDYHGEQPPRGAEAYFYRQGPRDYGTTKGANAATTAMSQDTYKGRLDSPLDLRKQNDAPLIATATVTLSVAQEQENEHEAHPTLSDRVPRGLDGSLPSEEIHSCLVLLWIPSGLKKSRKLSQCFVPGKEGRWRVRKLTLRITNTVVVVGVGSSEQQNEISDSRARVIKQGEIYIRKFDERQTLRFHEQVHNLSHVASFAVPPQFPVPLITTDTDTLATEEKEKTTKEGGTEDDARSERHEKHLNRKKAQSIHVAGSIVKPHSAGGRASDVERLLTPTSADAKKEKTEIKRLCADRRCVRFTCGDIGLRIVSSEGDVYPVAMPNSVEVETWLASLREMIRQHEHDAAFDNDNEEDYRYNDHQHDFDGGHQHVSRVPKEHLKIGISSEDSPFGPASPTTTIEATHSSGGVGFRQRSSPTAPISDAIAVTESARPDPSAFISSFLAREIKVRTSKKLGGVGAEGGALKSDVTIDLPPNGGEVRLIKSLKQKRPGTNVDIDESPETSTSRWRFSAARAGQPGDVSLFKLGKRTIGKPVMAVREKIGAVTTHTINAEECDIYIEFPWASTVIALVSRKRQQSLYLECESIEQRIAWETWLRLMGATKILSLEEQSALLNDDARSAKSGWREDDSHSTDSQSIQTMTLRPDSFVAVGQHQIRVSSSPRLKWSSRRLSSVASTAGGDNLDADGYEPTGNFFTDDVRDAAVDIHAAEGEEKEGRESLRRRQWRAESGSGSIGRSRSNSYGGGGEGRGRGGLGAAVSSSLWREEEVRAQDGDEVYLKDPSKGLFNPEEVARFRETHVSSMRAPPTPGFRRGGGLFFSGSSSPPSPFNGSRRGSSSPNPYSANPAVPLSAAALRSLDLRNARERERTGYSNGTGRGATSFLIGSDAEAFFRGEEGEAERSVNQKKIRSTASHLQAEEEEEQASSAVGAHSQSSNRSAQSTTEGNREKKEESAAENEDEVRPSSDRRSRTTATASPHTPHPNINQRRFSDQHTDEEGGEQDPRTTTEGDLRERSQILRGLLSALERDEQFTRTELQEGFFETLDGIRTEESSTFKREASRPTGKQQRKAPAMSPAPTPVRRDCLDSAAASVVDEEESEERTYLEELEEKRRRTLLRLSSIVAPRSLRPRTFISPTERDSDRSHRKTETQRRSNSKPTSRQLESTLGTLESLLGYRGTERQTEKIEASPTNQIRRHRDSNNKNEKPLDSDSDYGYEPDDFDANKYQRELLERAKNDEGTPSDYDYDESEASSNRDDERTVPMTLRSPARRSNPNAKDSRGESEYVQRMRCKLNETNKAVPPPTDAVDDDSAEITEKRREDRNNRSSLYATPIATLPSHVASLHGGGAYYAADSTVAIAVATAEAKRKEDMRRIIKLREELAAREQLNLSKNGNSSQAAGGFSQLSDTMNINNSGVLVTSSSTSPAITAAERRQLALETQLVAEEHQRVCGTERVNKNVASLISEAERIRKRADETRAAFSNGPINAIRQEEVALLRLRMHQHLEYEGRLGNYKVKRPSSSVVVEGREVDMEEIKSTADVLTNASAPRQGNKYSSRSAPTNFSTSPNTKPNATYMAVNFDTAYGRSSQLIHPVVDVDPYSSGAPLDESKSVADAVEEHRSFLRRAPQGPTRLLDLSRQALSTTLQCPRRRAGEDENEMREEHSGNGEGFSNGYNKNNSAAKRDESPINHRERSSSASRMIHVTFSNDSKKGSEAILPSSSSSASLSSRAMMIAAGMGLFSRVPICYNDASGVLHQKMVLSSAVNQREGLPQDKPLDGSTYSRLSAVSSPTNASGSQMYASVSSYSPERARRIVANEATAEGARRSRGDERKSDQLTHVLSSNTNTKTSQRLPEHEPNNRMGPSNNINLLDNALNFSFGFAGFDKTQTPSDSYTSGDDELPLFPSHSSRAPLPMQSLEGEDRMTDYLARVQHKTRYESREHVEAVAASTKAAPSASYGVRSSQCAICGADKRTVKICETTGRRHVFSGTGTGRGGGLSSFGANAAGEPLLLSRSGPEIFPAMTTHTKEHYLHAVPRRADRSMAFNGEDPNRHPPRVADDATFPAGASAVRDYDSTTSKWRGVRYGMEERDKRSRKSPFESPSAIVQDRDTLFTSALESTAMGLYSSGFYNHR